MFFILGLDSGDLAGMARAVALIPPDRLPPPIGQEDEISLALLRDGFSACFRL